MAKMNGNGHARALREEKRMLHVQLTEAELLTRGEAMSKAELRIEALKEERSDLTKLIGVEVKARAELAHTIERGSEERSVRCAWIEDWSANAMNLVRQDTGETVDMRPMSALDRQLEIDVDDSLVPGAGGVPLGAPSSGDPHAATKQLGAAAAPPKRARKSKAAPDVVLTLADSDPGTDDELHLHIVKPKRGRKRALATVGEVVEAKRKAAKKRAPKASKQRKRSASSTVNARA